MMKRTAFILSLTLGLACASRGQVMMLFTADSLSYITSPLAIDSLYYWFDASQGVTDSLGGAIANNEGVGQWNDLSGHGYHVTQTTDTDRPVYKTSALAGYPGIQFDRTDDFLKSTAHWWGSDNITVISVLKFFSATQNTEEVYISKYEATASANRQWFIRGSASAAYQMQLGTSSTGAAFGGALSDGQKTATYNLWTAVLDSGGTDYWYKDNSSQSIAGNTATAIYNSSAIGITVGALNAYGGSPNSFFGGIIMEIIVYAKALSAAQLTAVHNYLNRKYDLY